MIGGYRVGEPLQQYRLASFGRCYDQPALTETNGRQNINHPSGQVTVLPFEREACIRVTWTKIVERYAVFGFVGVVEVDFLDLEESQVSLALLGRPNLTGNRVTGPEIEALDLTGAHIYVIGPVEVIPVLTPQESVTLGQDLEDPFPPQNGITV